MPRAVSIAFLSLACAVASLAAEALAGPATGHSTAPLRPHWQIADNDRYSRGGEDYDRNRFRDADHMPPDRRELTGRPPRRGMIWHPGHWLWSRDGWHWERGYWVERRR